MNREELKTTVDEVSRVAILADEFYAKIAHVPASAPGKQMSSEQEKMFFARLANIPDLGTLSAKRCMSLYQEYLQWRGQPWIPDDPDKQRWGDVQMLISLHGQLRNTYLLPLLRGEHVEFSVAYETTAHLQGRTLVEHLLDQSHRFHGVEAVCRERPFPFGLCVACHKVFVQSRKGRPRRFCSPLCQTKRAPGQRAKEMQEYRRKRRQHELHIVRNIIREMSQANQEQWIHALQQQEVLQRKNRRQLAALINHVLTTR